MQALVQLQLSIKTKQKQWIKPTNKHCLSTDYPSGPQKSNIFPKLWSKWKESVQWVCFCASDGWFDVWLTRSCSALKSDWRHQYWAAAFNTNRLNSPAHQLKRLRVTLTDMQGPWGLNHPLFSYRKLFISESSQLCYSWKWIIPAQSKAKQSLLKVLC